MKTAQTSSYRSILQILNQNTTRLHETQVMVASGKKLRQPSDDPDGVAPSLQVKTQMKRAELFLKNNTAAQTRLKGQDTQLGQADSLLVRAIELTVANGDGIYGATERLGMANEISDLRAELLGVANSQVDGRYLYGGFQDRTAPFSVNPAYDPILDPRPVLYNGDNGVMQLEIAPAEQMGVSFPGNAVFLGDENGDGAVDPGRVDVFAVLTSLEERLRANDQAGATAVLDDLYAAQDQIGVYRSKTGTAAARLENSYGEVEDLQLELETLLSSYEDVDMAAAISKMAQQEQALEAAMSVTGRISKLNIFDYL